VEIPLTFGVEKQKHLRVRSDKSDPSTRVNFLATESAKLSLENHGSAAHIWLTLVLSILMVSDEKQNILSLRIGDS
jgi:hypothetical protein